MIRAEDGTARACACDVFVTAREKRVTTRSRNLPRGSCKAEIRRHKSRQRCAETRCPRPRVHRAGFPDTGTYLVRKLIRRNQVSLARTTPDPHARVGASENPGPGGPRGTEGRRVPARPALPCWHVRLRWHGTRPAFSPALPTPLPRATTAPSCAMLALPSTSATARTVDFGHAGRPSDEAAESRHPVGFGKPTSPHSSLVLAEKLRYYLQRQLC